MAPIRGAALATLRPLRASDLERMVAIDTVHTGHSRRPFIAKRLKAAMANPADFLHAGLEHGQQLAAFVLARIRRGEFGGDQPTAVLDLLGVARETQSRGLGRALMDGLAAAARAQGVRCIQSESEWTDLGLLRYFHASGFRLANRLVLERSTGVPFIGEADDA